jgi:hypothetical protein
MLIEVGYRLKSIPHQPTAMPLLLADTGLEVHQPTTVA